MWLHKQQVSNKSKNHEYVCLHFGRLALAEDAQQVDGEHEEAAESEVLVTFHHLQIAVLKKQKYCIIDLE